MDRLGDLDRVAWVRFASVYRDFRDIESFKEAIDALLEPETPDYRKHPDQFSLIDDDSIPPLRNGRRPRRAKRPAIGSQ